MPGFKIKPKMPKRYTFERILSIVSIQLEISNQDIMTKRRYREAVEARMIVMYLMRKYMKKTLSEIGRTFGKDHSTVIHALGTLDDLMFSDEDIKATVSKVEDLLITCR